MSSDNNNNPSSTGGDEFFPLSSRTVNRFVMNSSESTLSAPDTDSNSTNGIYLGLTDDTVEETDEELSTDEVAIIFSFLSPVEDIMRARRVCTTWRDAAKMTVPSSKFVVRSERSYNAMRVMSTELPNLQQLQILGFGWEHKYSDGEDPNERRATVTANYTTHDINIISNFLKLRVLHISQYAPLNGRFPVLFNFPLLNELSISKCSSLKFDLDMLVGLSSLKVLKLGIGTATYWDRDSGISRLTGNLSSLRVLRDTIEKVRIIDSQHIRGNFMDLADFPLLKELDLFRTGVTGDIRNIREHDFPALESLRLSSTVIGGLSYQFQSVAEVPSFMHTIHQLLQRALDLFEEYWLSAAFNWRLSEDSPDWYDRIRGPLPPFRVYIVQSGSRLEWRWSWCTANSVDNSCDINWLDPEPSSQSGDYETYIEGLESLQWRVDFYRGYSQPPTLAEYRRLCEEFLRRALP